MENPSQNKKEERANVANKPRDDCLTGACPPIQNDVDMNRIKLSEGSGGREMHNLITQIRKNLGTTKDWKNSGEDSATLKFQGTNLVFTTDSYIVTPLFFPGGNIGKLAFCGTVNDLAVMGAKPLGISLSLVLEEGFSKAELTKILQTIGELSKQYDIPIVTGDTKVMEKRSVDKIIINTSGVGFTDKPLDAQIEAGDAIIVSGSIGEHGAALLAKRYELITDIQSDSKPLHQEINDIKQYIKQAKDITRGGLASILNEVAHKNKVGMSIDEEIVPILPEVASVTQLLGIEIYSLACEGRFVCFCKSENQEKVLALLQKHNKTATIIGHIEAGTVVKVQTRFGKKILSMPSGNIVPRIC